MNDVTLINRDRGHYGENLKFRRKRLGLTQDDVSWKLNISQPQVSNLEYVRVQTRLGRKYAEVLSGYEVRLATQLFDEHPEALQDPRVRRRVWSTLLDELLRTVFPDDGTAGTAALAR